MLKNIAAVAAVLVLASGAALAADATQPAAPKGDSGGAANQTAAPTADQCATGYSAGMPWSEDAFKKACKL